MDGTMSERNVQMTGPRWCRPACYNGRTPSRTRTLLVALASVAVLVLLQPHCALGMKPRLRFMDYHCSKELDIYSELLLALKSTHLLPEVRHDTRQNHMACKVLLRAPPGFRIFLHFLWLRVSADHQHHDRVKIYDTFPVETELTPPGGLYGKLDRSLVIQDLAGSKIKDYRSSQNEILVEYVGNPTAQHPGFKILVTVFKTPDFNEECPSNLFKCPVEVGLCLPYSAACDGYSNCGARDAGDEKDCDSFETVTDLVDNYSMVYDILMVMCLPVVVFITFTIIAVCCMRRYIRLKITIHTERPVHYSAANGGRVKLEDKALARLYAPPSYEDVVTPSKAAMMAPPPAYSTLSDQVKAGEVEVMDSEDEMYRLSSSSSKRLARDREDRSNGRRSCNDSLSSLDEKSSPRIRRSRRHELSPQPYKGSYESQQWQRVRSQNGASVRSSDTEEDEDERERRNKKKGGKPKRTVCTKRRVDDLVSSSPTSRGDGEEGSHLLSPGNHHSSSNHLLPDLSDSSSPAPVSEEASEVTQCHSASGVTSASSSRSNPSASTTRASSHSTSSFLPSPSLSPPPTYSNISEDRPPKYKQRRSNTSPSDPPFDIRVKSKGGPKSLPNSNSSVPQEDQGKLAQGPNLHCVVEINPCSASPSTLKSSTPVAQAWNTSSPSRSSSSATDQDHTSHSETESRPPSNTNSRTESNGSLADQFVNQPIKEKTQASADSQLL
ncbi:hypothetical protein RRG08_044389 [Elysia crispata]|uniref:CUB domain-containing protein n=1 Tax=Elysia crispata TaxID=231223 RepID=A0AAE0ZV82_9GAST|nr:hypothetical protein RRG08_044389 [Elysia crispata]